MVQTASIIDSKTRGENFNPAQNDDEIRKVDNTQHLYTLDEAIEEAQFGKYQIILTILTGLCIFGSSIETTSVSYILPYAKCDLKLSQREQGVLNGISYFGVVFSTHLWGFLADTWGRKKVLLASAAGGFLFSFLSVFSVNTISMILLRFLAGAFVAGATSAGFSYISEFHTSATASRAVAFISIGMCCGLPSMSSLALFLIPMDWHIPIYIIEFKPWRLFLMCVSLINLLNVILLSFLPESPKFLLAMNRKEEALKVLSRIFAVNTGNSRDNYPVKDIEIVELGNSLSNANGIAEFFRLIVRQTAPVLRKPMLTNTWKFCFIFFSMFFIAHGIIVWLPDFLTQLQNYKGPPKVLCEIVGSKTSLNSTINTCTIDNKNVQAIESLFVMGICFAVLATVSSSFLKKIAPKKIVCGWLILSMLAGVLLSILTDFYAIVANFFIFVSCGICVNIVIAIATSLYPTNYRAMATALIVVCGRIGSVLGSSMIGLLLDDYCTSIFYLSGGVLISCACVFMLIGIKSQ